MKFNEMKYTRPDVEAKAAEIAGLTEQVAAAAGGEELLKLYDRFTAENDLLDTAATLVSIRHTVDTRDEFYDGENNYFDEKSPVLGDKNLGFYRAVLASPHREALEKKYGSILLEKMDVEVKSSDERLIPLQQEENALESAYSKLYASARVPFQGKELTISQLTPYKEDLNRSVRKEAFEAEGGFFDGHREELDEIYDKMVKNRTEQAKLLGHGSFTPLGDIRMQRLGYGRKEVAACREEVAKGIVPYAAKLKELQAKRTGIADPRFFDQTLQFADGNPGPKGTPEEILAAGQKMYRELSSETADFIDFMMAQDLFDVLSKPGKAPGGYCTFIPEYKSPFIFSNFNGTAGDVDVLTHEAGHAFAAYQAAKLDYTALLRSPSLESCEIHSMSMEFLTADFHHLFFKEDTAKYEIYHAADAMFFLPYGCQVDEFQECVYNQPGLTPNQRNQLWLDLEKKYRPWNNFEAIPFYGRGAGWQRQLHIYTAPFYYIDYVLAQAVALEFYLAWMDNKQDAWQRYLALVNKAGSKTYQGLVEAAGFATPFDAGVMQDVGKKIYNFIQKHPLSGQ